MTWRHVLCVAFLVGCGPDAPPARRAPPPSAPAPRAEAPSDDDEADDEAPEEALEPSAYGEDTLDAMDSRALEAACMQGSTAACDRLGH